MPKPIRRMTTIPVFSNRYGTLFNDNVVGPTNVPGEYLRWQWKRSGVVVIPRAGKCVAVCNMYRYPIQSSSLEFPRGGINEGESVESAALRELKEETGLTVTSIRRLGSIYPDTGLIENETHVVVAEIEMSDTRKMNSEPMESIDGEIIWKDIDEFGDWTRTGKIKCGVTLAAYSLLLAHHDRGD